MPIKDPDRRREAARLATARYRVRHPDRVRALAVSERARSTRAAWAERHPAARRAIRARNYAANAEDRRAYAREYYAGHRDERRRGAITWKRAHRPLVREQLARRYARRGGASGSHTLAEWTSKLDLLGWCCIYCGRDDVALTRDHKMPLIRGGSDDIENVVPACRPCNSAKGTRTAREYIAARVGRNAA